LGVRHQLTEPWGIVTAALLGGLGGAVTAALAPAAVVAVPVGVGIAAVVYGVKVTVGALAERGPGRQEPGGAGDLPTPVPGGAADGWLRHAEAAVRALRQLTESPRDPVIRDQIGDVDDHAAATLVDVRRIAGQVTLIEQAATRMSPGGLHGQHAAIEKALRGLPPGPLREERERALRAVADQLAIYRRLTEAREMLLARMQSTALGLDGLVARLSEVLALYATADGGARVGFSIGELNDDLDGLRAGLAESEELSRRVLAGGGSLPDGGSLPGGGSLPDGGSAPGGGSSPGGGPKTGGD
jgi:hypothetical protein